MRVRVLSDIHVECQADGGASFIDSLDTDCDLLVLAGDVGTVGGGLVNALVRFSERFTCPIVYVAGNHEYWHQTRGSTHAAIRKAVSRSNERLHYLDNDVLVLPSGQRVLGTTLWFPASVDAYNHAHEWSDFAAIQGFRNWNFKANEEAQSFLRREMRQGDIVVTHYLPSQKSIHPRYARERTNCYFLCELGELIAEKQPALWCHGHTHESADYTIGETRVVCNPFGYASLGMLNGVFRSDTTVRLGGTTTNDRYPS